jgi:RimJ/RimL family protein N-acetyltransferase
MENLKPKNFEDPILARSVDEATPEDVFLKGEYNAERRIRNLHTCAQEIARLALDNDQGNKRKIAHLIATMKEDAFGVKHSNVAKARAADQLLLLLEESIRDQSDFTISKELRSSSQTSRYHIREICCGESAGQVEAEKDALENLYDIVQRNRKKIGNWFAGYREDFHPVAEEKYIVSAGDLRGKFRSESQKSGRRHFAIIQDTRVERENACASQSQTPEQAVFERLDEDVSSYTLTPAPDFKEARITYTAEDGAEKAASLSQKQFTDIAQALRAKAGANAVGYMSLSTISLHKQRELQYWCDGSGVMSESLNALLHLLRGENDQHDTIEALIANAELNNTPSRAILRKAGEVHDDPSAVDHWPLRGSTGIIGLRGVPREAPMIAEPPLQTMIMPYAVYQVPIKNAKENQR